MIKWIDDLIDQWHTGKGTDRPLHAFLGMSWDQYGKFIKGEPGYVLGADEVGKGAWAGPLTVCAVLESSDWAHPGLADSKTLDAKAIRRIAGELEAKPTCFAIKDYASTLIDKYGLKVTHKLAFEDVIEPFREDYPDLFSDALIVLDGDSTLRYINHISLPKADSFVPQVMAASILAKNARDTWMRETAAKLYPEYGFELHVGYGTALHRERLEKYGPCPIHRMSFKPMLDLSARK